MGKKRIKKGDYKVTHDTFFDETFGMPSFGVAFLKAKLPRKIRKQLDLDKLTIERRKFRDELFRETRPDIVYHVPIRGTDELISFYIIAEHKSFDDHSAIFQLWGYIRQLCVQDVKERLTDPETEERKSWQKKTSSYRRSSRSSFITARHRFRARRNWQTCFTRFRVPKSTCRI